MPKLRRLCHRCGEPYTPTGKYSRLCNTCNPYRGKRMRKILVSEEDYDLIKKHKLKGYLSQLDNPPVKKK